MLPVASPGPSLASRLCFPLPRSSYICHSLGCCYISQSWALLHSSMDTGTTRSLYTDGQVYEWTVLAHGGMEWTLGSCMRKQQEPWELSEAAVL